jgi:hypothetical protein
MQGRRTAGKPFPSGTAVETVQWRRHGDEVRRLGPGRHALACRQQTVTGRSLMLERDRVYSKTYRHSREEFGQLRKQVHWDSVMQKS